MVGFLLLSRTQELLEGIKGIENEELLLYGYTLCMTVPLKSGVGLLQAQTGTPADRNTLQRHVSSSEASVKTWAEVDSCNNHGAGCVEVYGTTDSVLL